MLVEMCKCVIEVDDEYNSNRGTKRLATNVGWFRMAKHEYSEMLI